MPPERIAFLHIPKTAGSSVVHAFRQALGAENCRSQTPAVTDADFATHRFISGHQVLSAITPNAWRFTFLREPVAQIASHLRWLDHYNEPQFRRQSHQMAPLMRHVIVRVGQTDFASAQSLQEFFDWLPPNSPALLPNVQCEVLTRGPTKFAGAEALAAAAIANLQSLDFVGVVERGSADLARLFRMLDLPAPAELPRLNTLSAARRINLHDRPIRDVLERQMQADLRLYHHAAQPGLMDWVGTAWGQSRRHTGQARLAGAKSPP